MLQNKLKEQEIYSKEEQKKRKYLHNQLEEQRGAIRLFCRIRPLTNSELEREESNQIIVRAEDEFTATVFRNQKPLKYTFDSVYGPDITQAQIFEETKSLVQSAIDGYNVCIFAYGQTGSGKTHTILGDDADQGITPRSIKELYDTTKSMKNFEVRLSCYMVELYRTDLKDLLLPRDNPQVRLDIKENPADNNNVYIPQITQIPIETKEDAINNFRQGLDHRITRATRMNSASSRSHLIFTIIIESVNKQTKQRTKGKLSFVDLAGSEKTSKSGTDQEGAAEATAINQGLSALGNVINALSEGHKHIPYRDHPLTLLMKDSLGGSAKTLMFVNVSPSNYNESESKNSMDYATRVKMIKNKVVKNVESVNAAHIKRVAGD